MWVITVNHRYYLRSLNVKRVDGKKLNEKTWQATEDIDEAYLFENELECMAMKTFLNSISHFRYELGMFRIRSVEDIFTIKE